MHMTFAELLISQEIDLDAQLIEKVRKYCESCEQPAFEKWLRLLRQDVLSFVSWVQDYNVKPLAIEVPLCTGDAHLGFAGTVDLVCLLDVDVKGFFGETYKAGAKKGEPKETKRTERKLAIVDFKSGRTGHFYDSNEWQLAFCEALVQDNFVELCSDYDNIELFNWSPKDWKSAPSYNFKCHTGIHTWEDCSSMLKLHRHSNPVAPEKVTFRTLSGKVFLDSDLRQNIKTETLQDIIKDEIRIAGIAQ
jgi:hypothetical protein